jgi:hypothetical protein
MRTYFTLQFRWLDRHLRDFGIRPWLGYVLGAILFAGMSAYLFYRFEYAGWGYAFLALLSTARLSETDRNQFLLNTYPVREYRQLRLLENLGVALPFIAAMSIAGEWLPALTAVVAAGIMTLSNIDRLVPMTIPTPFSRRPFEFAVGFRRSWLLVLVLYILAAIAIRHGNFNLGMFALVALFLAAMTYYNEPEPTLFVWMHADDARSFLRKKMITAVLHASILSAPVIAALVIAWPYYALFPSIAVMVGTLYVIAMLLGKYAGYPSAINLPSGFMLALAVWFPPLLLGVIPYFHRRAVRQLTPYLS